MNDYSEILETRGEYRVSIVPMEHAEPPDWDGQGTIIQLDYRGAYGWRSEVVHADHGGMRAGIHHGDVLAEAWTHYSDFAKRGNREPMVERYLRIFHGVVGFDWFDTRDGKYVCIVTGDDLREWGFDSLDHFDTVTDSGGNPAEGILAAWRHWTDGEVYGWQIERHVQRGTVTRSMAGEHLDESWDEDAWDEVESVWGYYGTEDAEGQAREAFNDYLSREDVPA